jgi:hypothetical protein
MNRFGYDTAPSSDLDIALKVLRNVGFIGPITEAGRTSYQITEKGRHIATGLIYRSSYLEHVFHKALLPIVLIDHVHDEPRVEGSDDWTVNSIRNYFTLLTYIKSIESYRTGDSSVPQCYCIWPLMQKSVLPAIERILGTDFRGKRYQDPANWFVTKVCNRIRSLTTSWANKGILAG